MTPLYGGDWAPDYEHELDWGAWNLCGLNQDWDQDREWVASNGEVVQLNQLSQARASNILWFIWRRSEDDEEREELRNTKLVDRLRQIVANNREASNYPPHSRRPEFPTPSRRVSG